MGLVSQVSSFLPSKLKPNADPIGDRSGYDFGYLLKIVSCAPLPPTEAEFFELLRIWFPCIWDIKVGPLFVTSHLCAIWLTPLLAQYLMKSCKSLKGGLQEVADDLNVHSSQLHTSQPKSDGSCEQVPRIGPQHQAGSDSLLTAATFFKMRGKFFEDAIDSKYMVRPPPPPPLSHPLHFNANTS